MGLNLNEGKGSFPWSGITNYLVAIFLPSTVDVRRERTGWDSLIMAKYSQGGSDGKPMFRAFTISSFSTNSLLSWIAYQGVQFMVMNILIRARYFVHSGSSWR